MDFLSVPLTRGCGVGPVGCDDLSPLFMFEMCLWRLSMKEVPERKQSLLCPWNKDGGMSSRSCPLHHLLYFLIIFEKHLNIPKACRSRQELPLWSVPTSFIDFFFFKLILCLSGFVQGGPAEGGAEAPART